MATIFSYGTASFPNRLSSFAAELYYQHAFGKHCYLLQQQHVAVPSWHHEHDVHGTYWGSYSHECAALACGSNMRMHADLCTDDTDTLRSVFTQHDHTTVLYYSMNCPKVIKI